MSFFFIVSSIFHFSPNLQFSCAKILIIEQFSKNFGEYLRDFDCYAY